MKHIKHLLDVIDGVRDHMALGLMSDPGLSKTSQVKQWAEENDRQYCELIISQRMPSEISGMPMPMSDTRTMEIFDFETLLHLKDGDVLAFDEFTNGNIQTLNACLTLIQERTMLSGKKLPSLVIVAMGNPQGRCDLLPQTKQRFWWVDVRWDAKTWTDYIEREWGVRPTKVLIDYISKQYTGGFNDQTVFNYHTPRTIENLLRIAQEIDIDDPFWSVSDVDRVLVYSLYKTFDNITQFAQVKRALIDFMHQQKIERADKVFNLLVKIEHTRGMDELRHLIKKIEDEGEHPWLITYLKQEGLSDG